MSMSDDESLGIDFDTQRGRDWPSIRQFNIFVENRLGGLLNVVRRFEASDNTIISLTVNDSADCAIIRVVPANPERAYEILRQAKLPFTESNLLVVQLPEGDEPLLDTFKTLLMGEINIHYAYPVLVSPTGRTALAIHVEDIENAAATLERNGFRLFTEDDLGQD
ncbi:MAG: acetolactate synthase [Gemmataceae bacterium]